MANNPALLQQIEALHQQDAHLQIVNILQALSSGGLDYQLTCLLARAYINLDDPQQWPEALRLLNSVAGEGAEDPTWYFRTGGVHCRLATPEDLARAEELFRQGFALLPPDSPEAADWHRRCDTALSLCQADIRRQAAWDAYQDSLDLQKAQDFLLHGVLAGCFPTLSQVEGDAILLPQWQARLLPRVERLTQQQAVLGFHLEAPQWGTSLYECSAGMSSSPSQAICNAANLFFATFVQGLCQLEERLQPRPLETSFAGHPHRWEVYLSDIAAMGSSPAVTGQPWWELLGEDIARRLGNQKLCYVKIYGAKINGEVTGECRVDDVKSEELSQKVAQVVEGWPDVPFASQKQFFFLRQQEETTLPYPYLGPEGRQRRKEAVIQGSRLFRQCKTEADYDGYLPEAAALLKDATLAAECLTFLPELCAANAFPQLKEAETVEICREGMPPERVYKNQLADYYPLWTALYEALQEGAFGEDTNGVYQQYIGYSATYGAVRQIKEGGSQLEDCQLQPLVFQVDRDFEIR